jgi:hypothetical protein
LPESPRITAQQLRMATNSHSGGSLKSPRFAVLLVWLVAATLSLRAQVNFDVFVGHGMGLSDSAVKEGAWFPVTCEIQNDGPSFNAVVEISAGDIGGGQTRLVPVELPSNTRKRFSVPMFCANRYRMSVDAKLRTEKGKVVGERSGVEARAVVDASSPLVGSLSRTHGGAIALPDTGKNTSFRPAATHLSPDLFPDNPLALESLSLIYLNSSRVADLKAPQVTALLAWLHAGGHLVLAIEQPGDAAAAPWLRTLLPCTLGSVTPRQPHRELHEWLTSPFPPPGDLAKSTPAASSNLPNPFRDLAPDQTFETAPLPVAQATLRDGDVLIGDENAPLVINALRGRGELTVLLFSPELEPFRSWRHKSWFWARLANVPAEWLASVNSGTSATVPFDGVFGAMVDTKQIRKLPIGWLLLLLVAYLIVIGPLDQYWLKKINKQMLTWITFPIYVALFSLLIYFIGYKLRSGEMEWNELHVVDVIPHGERADFRGRAYCSAYSPANARYNVVSDQNFSVIRGEIAQGVGQESAKGVVKQRGDGFEAELNVPVWSSQLFVNDWWQQGTPPVQVSVIAPAGAPHIEVRVVNAAGKSLPAAKLVFEDRVYELGDITRGQTNQILRRNGAPLSSKIQGSVEELARAAQQRNRQFGGNEGSRLEDIFSSVTAASFLGLTTPHQDPNQWNNPYWSRFVVPPNFDLTSTMRGGDAILFAWMPGETLVPTINRFTPRYSRKDTVLRVAVPVAY